MDDLVNRLSVKTSEKKLDDKASDNESIQWGLVLFSTVYQNKFWRIRKIDKMRTSTKSKTLLMR